MSSEEEESDCNEAPCCPFRPAKVTEAHSLALTHVAGPALSEARAQAQIWEFVTGLGLAFNPYITQIGLLAMTSPCPFRPAKGVPLGTRRVRSLGAHIGSPDGAAAVGPKPLQGLDVPALRSD